MEETCACGRQLHYGGELTRGAVEDLIKEKGWLVQVTTPEGSWWIPRHYVALHGLVAAELPELAKRLGFARADQ